MTSEGFHTHKRHAERAAMIGGLLFALLLGAPPAPTVHAQSVDPPEKIVASAPGPQVTIKDYTFNPAALTVPVGATVTWTNRDDEPHTVTSSENVFTSPGLDEGETFSYEFSTPGTYTYHCKLHPEMTATITVK